MGDPARLTNEYAESIGTLDAEGRLTNQYVEVIRDPVEITPYARLTNQYTEVITHPVPPENQMARLTNQYVEAIIPLNFTRRRVRPNSNIV